MNLIPLICPKCNGEIDLDADSEFGFCKFCGTKIYVPNAIQSVKGTVGIDHSSEVENLIIRARRFRQEGRLQEAGEYYNRILDIDINNQEAINGLKVVESIVTNPNVFVKRDESKLYNNTALAYVYLDGKKVKSIVVGETVELTVPCGNHIVKVGNFSMKSQPVVINIENCRTRYNINFHYKIAGAIDITGQKVQ